MLDLNQRKIGLGMKLCASAYVPSWCAVVSLRGIVPSLAVAAQEQNLVLDVLGGIVIELGDLVIEALPWRERLMLLDVLVCGVSAVD